MYTSVYGGSRETLHKLNIPDTLSSSDELPLSEMKVVPVILYISESSTLPADTQLVTKTRYWKLRSTNHCAFYSLFQRRIVGIHVLNSTGRLNISGLLLTDL